MHRKPLVQYVNHPHYPTSPVACFVALIRPDNTIGVGFSQCHPNDNFDKKLGREIATGRAISGCTVTPVPYRFYNPDGSYEKKDTVGAALDVFRFRAITWFTPRLASDCDKRVDDAQLVFFIASKHDGHLRMP